MKVAIINNIIPPYREHFYDIILNNAIHEVKVFCQPSIAGSNIKSVHKKYGNKVHVLNSYSPFNNESLVFQFLPIVKLFRKYDVIVVDGNLRHISQAILSTVFKLFGKKIVIWSNVFTFGGSKQKQTLRLKWWKLFDNFLMYTNKDILELNKIGFENKNIISINNGLNQNLINNEVKCWDKELLLEFKRNHNISSQNILISSGRVNKVNEHLLTIEALKIVKQTIPDILWVVIGNGSEFENLRQVISECGLQDNVVMVGEIYEEDKKCPWFLISKAFIHSGPIGLSLFNAFGYSLPVVTHDQTSYHGPEFSLFEDGKTGYLFQFRNSDDLALKIMDSIQNNEEVLNIRKNVFEIVNSKNNTDIMASQFFKMMKSLQ